MDIWNFLLNTIEKWNLNIPQIILEMKIVIANLSTDCAQT